MRRRAGRTRDALLDAGMQLLVDQHLDGVAVDQIVQAAGVAKGSFYNYFADKESLADTIRDNIREEIERVVHEKNEGIADPAQRVARAVAIYVDYMVSDRRRAQVILRLLSGLASSRNPLNNGVRSDITAGLLTARFIIPSADTGVLLVLGTAIIALMRIVEEPNRYTAAIMTQQLCGLLLRGLGIPPQEAEGISAAAVHSYVVAVTK